MKHTIFKTVFIALFLAFTAINAQTYDGKNKISETKTFEVKNFTGIKVSTAIEAEIRIANEEKAEVTSNAMDFVDVKIKNNTLNIQYKNHKGSLNNVKTKVVVYMKSVESLSADSAGKINAIDEISSNNLKINADSAGKISAKINVKNIQAHADSTGKIILYGNADGAVFHSDSVGSIDASAMNIEKSLTASADSMGKIVYHASNKNVVITTDRDSGGKIIAK